MPSSATLLCLGNEESQAKAGRVPYPEIQSAHIGPLIVRWNGHQVPLREDRKEGDDEVGQTWTGQMPRSRTGYFVTAQLSTRAR